MLKKVGFLCVFILSLGLAPRHFVSAAPDFNVAPVLPANQVEPKHHYFDLLVTPNTTQNLTIQIQNTAAYSQRFLVSPNRATTGQDGDIDYTTHAPTKAKSLTVDIEALLPKPKTYTVPPRTTRQITLHLQTPTHSWDGIVLGAIRVKKLATQTNAGITADTAYTIGVQLRTTATLPTQPLMPQLTGVTMGRNGNDAQVIAKVENTTAAIQPGVQVKTTIHRVGQTKLLRQHTQKGIRMAPNAVLKFDPGVAQHALSPGHYQLALTVDQGRSTWHFTKTFTIAKTQVKTTTTHPKKATAPAIIPLLLLTAGILLALTLIILWRRQRKH
ncbi:MAG: DUF916 and DUF3324 domain-containing protein [Lactobacillus sp.]|jgi:hypothetical protein|nr:DUF916 and DUF3324 domain-containing protein [Lactobacillus sp.]MCI2033978.1 DUF916 and DUF3324 domain-containing protein [Lactobacillus sp.]